jgi:hypothetical protein
MGLMHLRPIQRHQIATVWPQVEHWLARIDDRHAPWWRMVDPRGKCESGYAQLWLIQNGETTKGIVITQITVDAERVAEVPVVAGVDMETWLHLLDDLEHWARSENCVALVSTAARAGWVKVLKDRGWRKTAVLMERRL